MGNLSTFGYASRTSKVNPNRVKRPRLPKRRNSRSQNHINPEIVHIQLAPLTIKKHRLFDCIPNTKKMVRTVLHKAAQSTAFNQWRDFFGVSATISSLHLYAKKYANCREHIILKTGKCLVNAVTVQVESTQKDDPVRRFRSFAYRLICAVNLVRDDVRGLAPSKKVPKSLCFALKRLSLHRELHF